MLVRDEPYVAITDENGKFLIENLPAGEWTFQFWHERPGTLSTLTKDGEKFVDRAGKVKVTIKAGETIDLGKLVIQGSKLEK